MNRQVVLTEFAKMRHLRIGLVAGVLVVIVVGMGLYTSVTSPDFIPTSDTAWNSLLLGMGMAMMMAAPLLLAVLASRQADIEHQTSGWLFFATSGVSRGRLCRVKWLALGTIVTAATISASLLILVAGLLLGIDVPAPLGRWFGFTAAVVVVNLAVLALHIVLSALLDNQLVGLGIGLLGTVIALFGREMPTWLAHVTPWGYYALSAAAGYQDEELVALTPEYLSIAGLGVVTVVLFALITKSFDHWEV